MSEVCLYFLVRYDEIHTIKQSFSKLFQISLGDVSIKETILPNISLIEVLTPAERSVKSVRNLNVKAINSNTAGKLSAFENEDIEVRLLLKRFKNIDKRESFNFLLQLLIYEPEEFSWLK